MMKIKFGFIVIYLIIINSFYSQNIIYDYHEDFICGNCAKQDQSLNKPSDSKSILDVTNYARVTPIVVRKGIDTFTLEIGFNDSEINSVKFKCSSIGYPGMIGQWINMYDDGTTNGDKIAGDNIFTSNNLTVRDAYENSVAYRASLSQYYWELYRSDGSIISGDYKSGTDSGLPITIRVIDPAIIGPSDIEIISDECQKSNFVVNLKSENIIGNYPSQYAGFDSSSTSFTKDIANKYFDYFRDDRDFLLIEKMIGTVEGNPRVAAYFGSTKRDFQGIGRSLFDGTASYGSSGRLRGIAAFMGQGGVSGGLSNHELLHHWGAYLDYSIGICNGHWVSPIIGMEVSGFTTPAKWDSIETVSDTSFNAWYSHKFYNDVSYYNSLELYLMGLVSPADVSQNYQVLINPVQIGSDPGKYNQYKADSLKNVTFDEILNIHGERIPDHNSSQKEFNLALIVPYDRFLTPIEMSYFDYLMQEYQKEENSFEGFGISFAEATGNRASMSTLLSYPLSVEEGFLNNINREYRLLNSYPNPFNPTTSINYILSEESMVDVTVYDILGRKVNRLISSKQPSGSHSVQWNGTDQLGNSVGAGIYFYQIRAGDFIQTRKMVLLK